MPQNESFEIHYQRALRSLAPAENMRMLRSMDQKIKNVEYNDIDLLLVQALQKMREATSEDLRNKMRGAGYDLSTTALAGHTRKLVASGIIRDSTRGKGEVAVWVLAPGAFTGATKGESN